MHSDRSRHHPEPPDPLRSPYELDRHRISTCTAFRRLQHKTQVFAPTLHDHFRNRLTHTLEVAQIARCLARRCAADEELCEAIALAHDLGHPPFSHAGETALSELMAGRGGFNHNAHSLRVVEYLEHPYPAFRGLNLTRATLAGLRAHATKFDEPCADSTGAVSTESEIVSLADRVAYDLHDLEDAIGAALVNPDDLTPLGLWAEAAACLELGPESGHLHAIRRPVLENILNRLLLDVLSNAAEGGVPVASAESQARRTQTPRAAGPARPLPIRLSFDGEIQLRKLENLLLLQVYRHPDIAGADAEGQQKIHQLFSAYMKNPELMPPRFVQRLAEQGAHRVICDYIAGMTDSFCSAQHRKHCPPGP